MIGSLGKVLDDNFSTTTHNSRLMSDDPVFNSMKNRMEVLEQENQQLKQQLSEYNAKLSENDAKLEAILQHINILLP